jgi:hypothetical protein
MSGFAPNHDLDFIRDDGTTVAVSAEIRCEGYPLPYYVVDHVATLPGTDSVVHLTEAEIERLDADVAESPPGE